MGQIGEELRMHREMKGLSLRDVEETTKIRMKYLIALEADDFDALPGKVYVVGFLRTYARFLGINDEALVNSLKTMPNFEEREEEVIVEKKRKPKEKKQKPIVLIIILVAVLIASGLFYAFTRGDKEIKTPNDSVPQTETPQDSEESPSTTPNIPETESPTDQNSKPINGVSVTVIVKESNCWLDVSIDGKKDYKGTLKAGENRTFIGQDKITIKYGNAGVVEVIANGERVYPLGNIGQVITKEYLEN